MALDPAGGGRCHNGRAGEGVGAGPRSAHGRGSAIALACIARWLRADARGPDNGLRTGARTHRPGVVQWARGGVGSPACLARLRPDEQARAPGARRGHGSRPGARPGGWQSACSARPLRVSSARLSEAARRWGHGAPPPPPQWQPRACLPLACARPHVGARDGPRPASRTRPQARRRRAPGARPGSHRAQAPHGTGTGAARPFLLAWRLPAGAREGLGATCSLAAPSTRVRLPLAAGAAPVGDGGWGRLGFETLAAPI
jgi:hypothetical protein